MAPVTDEQVELVRSLVAAIPLGRVSTPTATSQLSQGFPVRVLSAGLCGPIPRICPGTG